MHFTYAEAVDSKTLKQGDLLIRTPELVAVLEEFHAYFAKEHYTHFLVLTQSCDLQQRPKTKSRYITLSAVRPLTTLINRFVDDLPTTTKFQGEIYCSDSNKSKLTDQIRKVLDNTYPGYFFLKAEPELELKHDSCAFLELSVPIRSDLHYETCTAAKRLELSGDFRAKLGWLVGDLFSRVGTKDYAPGVGFDKRRFDAFLEETIKSHVYLVPSKQFARFTANAKEAESVDEIFGKIEADLAKEKQEKAKNLVTQIARTTPLENSQRTELAEALLAYSGLNAFFSG